MSLRRMILILLTAFSFTMKAQPKTDSLSHHSPRKAILLSALLPGAGQAYNKKYWKIPVIYALGGGATYLLYINQNRFTDFRDAVRFSANNGNVPVTLYGDTYTREQLTVGRDSYRRTRDLSILGVALVYALQLIDANVDAHLYGWDMSPSLTYINKNTIPLITLTHTFR